MARNDTVAIALSSNRLLDDEAINKSDVAMCGRSTILPQFHALFPGAVITRVENTRGCINYGL